MKRLCVCLAALLTAVPLLAQEETCVNTGKWRVWSSERLVDRPKVQLHYPLTYLFDNDPRTAWVYRGAIKDALFTQEPSRFNITVEFNRKRRVDGFRIMNGYNKDRKTFERNNRITGVSVIAGTDSRVAVFKLPDAMGWHPVRFKPLHTKQLTLYFTSLAKPKNVDICVSGLELLADGKSIPFSLPPYFLFSRGAG